MTVISIRRSMKEALRCELELETDGSLGLPIDFKALSEKRAAGPLELEMNFFGWNTLTKVGNRAACASLITESSEDIVPYPHSSSCAAIGERLHLPRVINIISDLSKRLPAIFSNGPADGSCTDKLCKVGALIPALVIAAVYLIDRLSSAAHEPLGELLKATTGLLLAASAVYALIGQRRIAAFKGLRMNSGLLLWPQLPISAAACWQLSQHDGIAAMGDLVPAVIFSTVLVSIRLLSARTALPVLTALNICLLFKVFRHPGNVESIAMLFEVLILPLFGFLVAWRAGSSAKKKAGLQQAKDELIQEKHWSAEDARTEERIRLSRELHDVTGHKLTLLKLNLGLMVQDNPSAELLERCQKITEELILDMRRVVSTLREHDDIDLRKSLIELVPKLSRPKVRLELTPAIGTVGSAESNALLRCAQEGLANALRHSRADSIVIRLAPEQGGVRLMIEDDGRALAVPTAGNGLRGMRERIEALNGRFGIEIREGSGGLRLSVWLPVNAEVSI